MITDRVLLREQALLGLQDAYYLGSEIIGLSRDELPRPEAEVKPIYDWFSQERPPWLQPRDVWLRFWSSPRFTAKTYIAAVNCLQRIIRNPNITILWQSQQKNMAMDAVGIIKEWLETPEIVRLYGLFKSGAWGKEEFTVSQRTSKALKDPTLRSLGLDDPTQGKRCHLNVWDDLVGDTNTSEDGLRKVENRIDATAPLIRIGGEGWFLCTRWSPYDPSSNAQTISDRPGILRQWELWKRGDAGFTWDAPGHRGFFGAYAVDGDEEFFPHAVPGEPLFPSVLWEEKLDMLRATKSPTFFSSQYLNEPIPEESRHFSEEDFRYVDTWVDGKLNEALVGWVPFMSIDPSTARANVKNADDTTFCVGFIRWVKDTFDVHVAEWTGGRWKTDRVNDTFFNLFTQYRPRMVYPEVNVGGDWFLNPLRQRAREMGLFLPIQEVKGSLHGTGKKKQRILSISDYYRQRRITHDKKLKNSKGEFQLLNYTGDGKGHDDFADVLAHLILEATKKRWASRDDAAPRLAMAVEERYPSVG